MKIVLIILCAFLLKAEADAQTWQRISPTDVDTLAKMLVFKDKNDSVHIMAYNSWKLFSLQIGKDWISIDNLEDGCFVPDANPSYQQNFLSFSNIIYSPQYNSVYINYDGGWCGSIDGGKMKFVKYYTNLNWYTVVVTMGTKGFGTNSNTAISKPTGIIYLQFEDEIHFIEKSVFQDTMFYHHTFPPPLLDSHPLNTRKTRIFTAHDYKDSTLYSSLQSDTLISNGWVYYDNLFKNTEHDSTWGVYRSSCAGSK